MRSIAGHWGGACTAAPYYRHERGRVAGRGHLSELGAARARHGIGLIDSQDSRAARALLVRTWATTKR